MTASNIASCLQTVRSSVHSRRRRVQIHGFNFALFHLTAARELPKEGIGLLTRVLVLDGLVVPIVEILDAAVEIDAQVVCREAQHLAHR